ncbi:MAG: DNA-binding response regulator [Ignavibacteria bacterium]
MTAKSELDNVIRVAIVDDDEDVRKGYRWMIERSTGFVVTGTYASCSDIRSHIDESPPDVILMDIGLPEKSGTECVRLLKRQYPNIQFLMLTVYTDDENIFQSLRAGAVGYLLKKTTPAKLLEAISDAYHGGAPMASEIARKVLAYFQHEHTANVTDALSLHAKSKSSKP